jgi:DNA recombination-dependent growth factor C
MKEVHVCTARAMSLSFMNSSYMYVLVDSLSEKQKEAILVDFSRKEQALPVLPILPQTPPSTS